MCLGRGSSLASRPGHVQSETSQIFHQRKLWQGDPLCQRNKQTDIDEGAFLERQLLLRPLWPSETHRQLQKTGGKKKRQPTELKYIHVQRQTKNLPHTHWNKMEGDQGESKPWTSASCGNLNVTLTFCMTRSNQRAKTCSRHLISLASQDSIWRLSQHPSLSVAHCHSYNVGLQDQNVLIPHQHHPLPTIPQSVWLYLKIHLDYSKESRYNRAELLALST